MPAFRHRRPLTNHFVTPARRRGLLQVGYATALAGLALAGCAFAPDYPSALDAPLMVGDAKVTVQSLQCLPAGIVLAAGYTESLSRLEGVVLRSHDRGASWARVPLDSGALGVSVWLLGLPGGDEQAWHHVSGYRVGENTLSTVLTLAYRPGPWWITEDAGRSWRRVEPRVPLPATSVMFAPAPKLVDADGAGTLVAVADGEGDALTLLRSGDRGRTWSRQPFPALKQFPSLVSDGRGTLVLTGRASSDRGAIYWSADSGATWRESSIFVQSPTPVSLQVPSALKLYHSPSGALVAYNANHLGKGRSAARIYSSADGGRNWSLAAEFSRIGRIVGIAGDATGRIVAVSEWGIVLLSDDGGAGWRKSARPVPAATEIGASNVVFAPDGAVLATLDRARFARSRDGGETWHAVESGLPDRQFVLDSHCVDGAGLIVAGGSGGMITRSTDWGVTWQRGQMQGAARQN
jgi:photosystem II stability/assembly factor-like uncharacterized protein